MHRALDPPAHLIGVLLAQLLPLNRPGELLLDFADALRQRRVVDLAHDHLIAGLRGYLRDAVTHQPGTQHAHPLDPLRHSDLPLAFSAAGRRAYYAPVPCSGERR